MDSKLYSELSKAGEKLGFNLSLYANDDNPAATRAAKLLARQFLKEFAGYCDEHGYRLTAGAARFIGDDMYTYMAVENAEGHKLMILSVPHDDYIEVKNDAQ